LTLTIYIAKFISEDIRIPNITGVIDRNFEAKSGDDLKIPAFLRQKN